jgi:two-component system, LytTR family, response regulator
MIEAIIIDDEELSLFALYKKLQAFPTIHVAKTYTKHEQILNDLKKEKIDVAFLDIEMASLNGLDLAEAILSTQPSIQIVFVTAYSEYAVKAFEIDSVDYLLKPVMTKRLETTINRLIAKIDKKKDIQIKEATKKPLIITCFNEFQVFQDHQPVQFKTAKVKELFAFLLTHKNSYIHRDVIIESLWPEQDYKKSKIHLHTCLSHLRKKLELLGYSNCIHFSNQSYSISIEPLQCDISDFVNTFENLDMIDEMNIKVVEETTKLYTGPYMALNDYGWTYEKSQEIQNKMMNVLDKLIEHFQHIDTNKTLYYLYFQLKLNPYLDEKVMKIMQLLIQQGNRSRAINTYQQYEQLLITDLGITPDKPLIQLYRLLVTT